MNSATFLIKFAILYDAAKPDLNWRLGLQSARVKNVPVNHTDLNPFKNPIRYLAGKLGGSGLTRLREDGSPSISLDTKLNKTFPATAKAKSFNIDMTLPGAKGSMLAHELDEASFAPAKGYARTLVSNVSSKEMSDILSKGKPGSLQKAVQEGRVAHYDPRVLLNEAHSAASGEFSPEHLNQMTLARKATGEFDALKRLGVNYGKSLLPTDGRAYRKALSKLNFTNQNWPMASHGNVPKLWSLHPDDVTEALRLYRG